MSRFGKSNWEIEAKEQESRPPTSSRRFTYSRNTEWCYILFIWYQYTCWKPWDVFSVLPRENNGTDRDTLSLDIVNFREVIFFHDGSFVSRDVRLLDSFISGFRAFTVEFSSGSRRGARGRGARKSLIFRPKWNPKGPPSPSPPPSLPCWRSGSTIGMFGFIYALTRINVHRALVLLFRKVKSIRFADYSDPLEIDYGCPWITIVKFTYPPRLPASAISLQGDSIPLFLLVLLRKRNANERQ